MRRWEIKTVYIRTTKLHSEEAELNAVAADGWEPYAAHADAGGIRHYFRRERAD